MSARHLLHPTRLSLPHLRHRWRQEGFERRPTSTSSSVPAASSSIDSLHSEFIASAANKSSTEAHEQARLTNTTTGETPSNPAENPAGNEGDKKEWTGTLNPTRTHLFKLLLPLPRSLQHPYRSTSTPEPTSTPTSTPVQTAFLLHPAQPLSFVSRLILGSLPSSERGAEVEFRAISGPDVDGVEDQLATRHGTDEEIESSGADTSESRQDQDRSATTNGPDAELENVIDASSEGGPVLSDRKKGKGDWQEVRWSSSTDLGDFIKNATASQSFRILIHPEPPSAPAQPSSLTSSSSSASPHSLPTPFALLIKIPSFASRTVYLRKRLLWLTGEVAEMTGVKKRLDSHAHTTARRLASSGLAGLVVYWGVVFKLTFYSSLGWDAMEPITYLSGLSTVIVGYLFFLYHNREVSYSSILDISVSARQQTLYEKNGLDVERWTELVAEAKTLRKEIARIAADYNFDWKGQLENLGDAEVIRNTVKSPQQTPKAATDSTPLQAEPNSSNSDPGKKTIETQARIVTSSGEMVDIDATIDEALEEEEETRRKEASRRKGRTPGDKKSGDDLSLKRGEEKGVQAGREAAKGV